MDHAPPSPESPPPPDAPGQARKPRRRTADYRWTQPKVIAFLEALSRCGQVAEAARAVGMSRTSAYRLRVAMGSARFDAAFEGARRNGIRARAAASMARAESARSVWEGPGLAALAARERAAQGDGSGAQGDAVAAQSDTWTTQIDAPLPQGDGYSRKVTKNTPGPCNTRSMSPAMSPAMSYGEAAPARLAF